MLLAILGREPQLSLAELESIVGAGQLTKAADQAALVDVSELPVPFARLGGTIKLARVIDKLESQDWRAIAKQLAANLDFCQLFDCSHDHTFELGISAYNLSVSPREITGLALDLKKKFRRESPAHRLRVVPNKQSELSSAQVLHNHLYDRAKGAEIIILGAKNGKTYLALTEAVQDIDAYSKRDFDRPCRDARVGMLPPKLAQIILTLAVGARSSALVLDPFCGSGVVVQEAVLQGHTGVGSDVDKRMVDCSAQNLKWLEQTHQLTMQATLEPADATTHTWSQPFDTVAAELFLGPPLEKLPSQGELERIAAEVGTLLLAFLTNLARQSPVGLRCCLAVPAWQYERQRFQSLPVLDQMADLGYTWAQFSHVNTRELYYAREDQIVARQLLILERI